MPVRGGIRDPEICFDFEAVGLAVDGTALSEKLVAFVIHGGPGSDLRIFK